MAAFEFVEFQIQSTTAINVWNFVEAVLLSFILKTKVKGSKRNSELSTFERFKFRFFEIFRLKITHFRNQSLMRCQDWVKISKLTS